ncbi:hypothetical protein BS297_27215 [Rhodococcus erythropolis]|uniref:Uncharacterized protein n=1 Tax=Rhodococcus erythropolis TaxID=1833 RepID=A0A0C3ABR9_RHOER|nr:hypothetical protein BS297_27215 [Rhodococcus erythropolis]KIM17519.1 hypothetical protein QV65_04655 [Rhodococcus erythropolis]
MSVGRWFQYRAWVIRGWKHAMYYNVDLVDVASTPIERIRPDGVQVNGQVRPVDVIVFSLTDTWAAGPLIYLGLAAHGFSNMFSITGLSREGGTKNTLHLLAIKQVRIPMVLPRVECTSSRTTQKELAMTQRDRLDPESRGPLGIGKRRRDRSALPEDLGRTNFRPPHSATSVPDTGDRPHV